MIKTEILTNLGARHVITLADDLGFRDLSEAHEFVVKTLLDDGIFSNDVAGEYLEVNCLDAYQYIKLWREDEMPHLGMAWPPIQDEAEPWDFVAASVTVLGERIPVQGMAITRNGKNFYMPLTVSRPDGKGDIPALEAMSADTLRASFGQYLAGTGQLAEAVVPPFTLLGTEAAAYLMDFAQQDNPDPVQPGEVTARAAGSVLE